MADDITLTVRVRDMTRGDFTRLRQRMRGMDNDLRRVARSGGGASTQLDRLSRSVRSVSDRMNMLHRRGGAARSEMTHMRRTMGLLGRELRSAARDGDLTEAQFLSLSRQLERTRLDFDHLTNDVDRHSSAAREAARAADALRRAEHRRGVEETAAARMDAQRTRLLEERAQAMGRLHAVALRVDAQRTRALQQQAQEQGRVHTAALRMEEERARALQQQAQARGRTHATALRMDAERTRALQRLAQEQGRLHAAALRMDEERTQAAQRDAQTMGRTHTAALRMEAERTRAIQERAQAMGRLHAAALRMDAQRTANSQNADLNNLRRDAGDVDLSVRFRGMSDEAFRRLTSSLDGMRSALGGVSSTSSATRRNVDVLTRDIDTLGRVLRTARDEGSLARRDFDALRGSLTIFGRSLRDMRRSGQLTRSEFRAIRQELRSLDGQTSVLGRLGSAANTAGRRVQHSIHGLMIRALLLLAPALIPIGAVAGKSMGKLVAAFGAGALAVAAFGLALLPQVVAIKKASDAQTEYTDAVSRFGAGSKLTRDAAAAYAKALEGLSPAAREASVAFGLLREDFSAWSDALSNITVPVMTKSFAAASALLPRLTPLVRAAATELGRMMTIITGGAQTSGITRMMDQLGEFAGGALARMNTGLAKLIQNINEGKYQGAFSEFLAYANEVGPQVTRTLDSLWEATKHLLESLQGVGMGVLVFVDALSKLILAIPSGLLGKLLEFVLIMKAVKMAAAGLAAAAAGLAAFRVQVAAAGVAAGAATGAFGSLAAGFGALSAGARLGLVGAVIAGLVIGFEALSDAAKPLPVDIDRLTTSLAKLAVTGKSSGQFAETFGDLDGVTERFRKFQEATQSINADPLIVLTDKVPLLRDFTRGLQGGIDDIINGADSFSTLSDEFNALDESLAGLVEGGKADEAAKLFEQIKEGLLADGVTTDSINDAFASYLESLDTFNFEQQAAEDAMGVFGDQALRVKGILDDQRRAADGLRQSIFSLNQVNRDAASAQIAGEQAIATLSESFKENGNSLDITTKAGQENRTALLGLAAATEEVYLRTLEQTGSYELAAEASDRLYQSFLDQTEGATGSKEAAQRLADQYIKMPADVTTSLAVRTEEAINGLDTFIAAVEAAPGAKEVYVQALTKDAIELLESLGYKVERMPDGQFKVTAKTGQALSDIGDVQAARDGLADKTITLTINKFQTTTIKTIEQYQRDYLVGQSQHDIVGGAAGGVVPGYASGGGVQVAPNGFLRGPGSGTSDDILAMFASGAVGRVSNTEFVVNAASTRKYLPLLHAINEDRLKVAGFAKGGVTKKEKEARAAARGDLTISHFGKMAGFQKTEFRQDLALPDSVKSLVGALNEWRSIIKKATHGSTEKKLLQQLDKAGKALIGYEKKLSKVNKELDKAKDRLSDLKQAAAQMKESVKSGVLSATNVTRLAGGEERLTTSGLIAGMKDSRDKSSAFAKALADLEAKGVSKTIISQIAEAGIDGGGLETAGALLGASSAQISQINAMQTQIEKAAGTAGKNAADSMYAAGIGAAQGLVKGLEKEKRNIEKAMMDIALSMEKAIKAALGIKSPSKVMQKVGEYTADGFAIGMERNRRVPGAWASMLNVPARSGGSGGGGRVVIELRSSGSAQDEFLLQMLRKAIRVRGGDVQVVLGK